MNWKRYLEYGHDEYAKNFDDLWESGPFDVQDHAEDPPERSWSSSPASAGARSSLGTRPSGG
eukprot:2857438-Alexandrium_andersonii.AAC.1